MEQYGTMWNNLKQFRTKSQDGFTGVFPRGFLWKKSFRSFTYKSTSWNDGLVSGEICPKGMPLAKQFGTKWNKVSRQFHKSFRSFKNSQYTFVCWIVRYETTWNNMEQFGTKFQDGFTGVFPRGFLWKKSFRGFTLKSTSWNYMKLRGTI